MNDSNNRKIGVILSYLSIIISTLLSLLYTPFMIRMLGQSEYGLYSLVASIINYLTVLDFGFSNAIIVYTSKYRAQKKYKEEMELHGMFNIIFKIIGIIIAISGLIIYFNVDNIFKNSMTNLEIHKMKIMMIILSFNLFLTFSFAIYSSIISAYEKFIFQKLVVIIHSLLKPLLIIPLLILGFKSIALCIIITITNIIVLLSNYLYCKKHLKINVKFIGFNKKLFKTILGYSIWIFLAIIVDKINWSLDNFILGSVSGTLAVAVYSLASTLNQLFCNLSYVISSILLPKISKMVSKNYNAEELTKEFIKIGRIQYFLIFLMASGLILVGKEFFYIWAGKGYEDSYYVALILILPVCIPLIQNLAISIRQAINKHKFSAIVNIAIAFLNLIISIPLAKKYGAIGAAIGTGSGIIISNIINNIYYYKVIKLNIIKFWKEIIKMTLIFIIPFIIILILKHFYYFSEMFNIIIYGGIYTIIYIFAAYYFCMNNYEKELINKILNKIRIKRKIKKTN